MIPDNSFINFGGITTSFCDSSRSSIIIFFAGCPYRCSWCHNKNLWNTKNYINIDVVKNLIAENSEFVSEVIFSGGEPGYQPEALIELLKYTKGLGLLSGIETSGYNSFRLIPAFESNLIDFIYLDFKTSPYKYDEVTHYAFSFDGVETMMTLCKEFNISCELRITQVPEIISESIISQIKYLANVFGFSYKIQEMGTLK